MSKKDDLEKAVREAQETLKVGPSVLSLVFFNDTSWGLNFNGERYTSLDPSSSGVEFIAAVLHGEEKTVDERNKERRIEEAIKAGTLKREDVEKEEKSIEEHQNEKESEIKELEINNEVEDDKLEKPKKKRGRKKKIVVV